jgi:hypothetical protein
MKKILRLVTTSVLTLTLVACGEASSSVSSSVNTGTSTVPNVSSAYANVTSVTLSAATATLTQVLGAQRRVTVTAALNANTNPNLSLEWFVNGVKQAQISRIFDFTPTEAGSFAITARVGNLTSNTLTVTATSPVFVAKETSFKKANLIEIVADGGFNVSLVGASLEASSYYSIADGKYVLNLSEPVVQGTVVNVRFEKQGFATTVVPVTFDTRTLSLDEFEVQNAVSAAFVAIPAVAGVYQVVKPFEATAAFNKTYRISMLNKNVIPEIGTTSLSIETTVPTGATAVPVLTKLVSTLADETFTVTKDTVAGLYTHKISVGGRTLEVKVQVLEATPEIVVNESKYTYVDNVTGNNLPYAVQMYRNLDSTDDFDTLGEEVPVTLNAAGEYVVTKQNETFYSTANFDVIEFEFIARHFAKSDFVTNQFAVALFGPTEFAAREQLFSGMATKNPLTGAVGTRYNVWDLLNDGTDDNDISNNSILSFGTNFSVADTQGTSNTSHKGTLYQFIDAGTLPGLYTFVITAGPLGAQLNKEVKVRVVEPTARLDFVPVSFTSTHANATPKTATRNHALTSTAPNVFEIEKPVAAGDTYLLDWAIVLSNYQSKVVTDFQTISADQALTAQNRNLFAKTSGVKLDDNFKLIPFVSVETVVLNQTTKKFTIADLPVPNTAVSYTVTALETTAGLTAAGNPIAHAANGIAVPTNTDIAANSDAYAVGTFTQLPTAVEGEKITLEFKFYTSAAGSATSTQVGDTLTRVIYISGYADVVEFGGQSFANEAGFGNDTYSLVDFSLQTSGPNLTTFPKVDLTRTAIRMSPLSSGLAIYERSAVANRKTRIDAALTAALKAERDLNYSAFDGANTYFYNLETVATPSVFSSTATEITSLTPVGTFTLTMMVDQLVKTITIIVKNPSTKVSVLSVTEDVGTTNAGFINNYVNTNGLHTLAENSNFTLGAAASSRLRVLGTAGTSVASTSFVAPVNGVYTVALSAVTPDQLLGFVAVNDLAIGSYSYNISKKYPDGRVVTFNDIATVTAHDDNGLAIFGTVTGDSIKTAANTIFNANWIISETGALLKGQYVYEFTINGVTRKAEVNVLDSVGLDITNVSIAGNNMTKFGNGFLVSLANAIGSLEIEFDLNLVTSDNYVRVLSYSSASGSVVTPTDWLTNNTIANTVYTKLSDLDGSLKLANLASGTGGNAAASLDTLFIVIEIYRVVPFSSATGTVLANVGKLALVSSQTLKLRIDAFA